MQMNPYLSFKGEYEAAFKFYEQCLGGELGAIFRYAWTPLADHVPADWSDNGHQKMDTYDIATHGQLCACRVEVNKSL